VRVGLNPAVAATVVPLVAQGSIAVCPHVLLEIGFSAPASDYQDIVGRVRRTMVMLYPDKASGARALEVQGLLAVTSQHRTAKLSDLMIAACAETNGLTVLHYDKDFDAIAAVTGQPTMWVVPRGSVS